MIPQEADEISYFTEEKVTESVVPKYQTSDFGDGNKVVLPGFNIEIKMSQRANAYERSAYTLLALLGDIGGFNGAIIILPTYLMSFYTPRMYQASVYS